MADMGTSPPPYISGRPGSVCWQRARGQRCSEALHGFLCGRHAQRIAVGIALMILGIGLSFCSVSVNQTTAPRLPAVSLGFWSQRTQVRSTADQPRCLFARHWCWLRAALGARNEHALGNDGPNRSARAPKRARHGIRREPGSAVGHDGGRCAGRHRRIVLSLFTQAAGTRGFRAAGLMAVAL